MRYTLLLACCLCAPAAAQSPVPDTTAPWQYFPLEVGDAWEYMWWTIPDGGPPFPSGLLRAHVEADTVVEGLAFAVVRETQFSLEGEPLSNFTSLVRFDTTHAALAQINRFGEGIAPWSGPGGFVWQWGCRLDAPFPPTPQAPGYPVDCFVYDFSPSQTGTITGGYQQPVTIGGDTVMAALKTVSTFIGVDASATFAAGIGATRVYYWEFGGYFGELAYAHVGGVTYGTPIVRVEHPTPPPVALHLSVAPNPARHLATATLTLPVAGDVRVLLYDLLGRSVAVLAEGPRQAGVHALDVGASGLRPGVYVVRAEADGRRATARVTIH